MVIVGVVEVDVEVGADGETEAGQSLVEGNTLAKASTGRQRLLTRQIRTRGGGGGGTGVFVVRLCSARQRTERIIAC